MEQLDIDFLFVIGNRKQKSQFIAALSEYDAHICHVIYGKGSVRSNEILKSFGLVHEQNKVIIISIIKNSNTDALIDMFNNKFSFCQPNTGIAFTIPVEKMKY
ncbi:MAG: hypothetical protein LBU04_05630 [Christensenellaceae bacterium]|jgi:hypothetical protein|nr:hypothetical protein [Christensenellaceae bacterium]